MEIRYSALDNGIILIRLSGRLDIIGTGEIETNSQAIAPGKKCA